MFFENRADAGVKLAEVVRATGRDFSGWSVVGLARGGVITAGPVAAALQLPLRALCVEDLHTSSGTVVVSSLGTVHVLGYGLSGDSREPDVPLVDLSTERLLELAYDLRVKDIRFNGTFCGELSQRIIVVDDGVVSGNTAAAAIAALRRHGAAEVVLAVPVRPPWITPDRVGADSIIEWRVTKLSSPTTGKFYFSFNDTPDEEVTETIRRSAA